MKIWLFLVVSLLLIFILGCTSTPKDMANKATGMAVVAVNSVSEKVSDTQEKITNCVKYCLDLNKDSSRHSKDTWFNIEPDFCTDECVKAGIKCTVIFFQGTTCNVMCELNNTAYCEP